MTTTKTDDIEILRKSVRKLKVLSLFLCILSLILLVAFATVASQVLSSPHCLIYGP
jgi:hypothetical protein